MFQIGGVEIMKESSGIHVHKHIGEYIKNNKGDRIGYLLAFVDSSQAVKIGWSLYAKNKEKKRFNKFLAKCIAYLRAVEASKIDSPPSIGPAITRFKNRCARYFKREAGHVDD